MTIQREIESIIKSGMGRIVAINSAEELNAFLRSIDNVAIYALNDAQVAQMSPEIRSDENHRQLTRLRLTALRRAGQILMNGQAFPGTMDDETTGRALSLATMDEKAFEAEISNASKVTVV